MTLQLHSPPQDFRRRRNDLQRAQRTLLRRFQEHGAIVQKLKERGRLHQAFVTAKLKDIDLAQKAASEVAANNIERPGPRNRDWTPQENAKFVSDAIAHRCQYLQLSRPWPRQYSDDAHTGGVKVTHFKCDDPRQLKDLFERGIDFVMTNRLEPMNAAFAALGIDKYEEPVGTDPAKAL